MPWTDRCPSAGKPSAGTLVSPAQSVYKSLATAYPPNRFLAPVCTYCSYAAVGAKSANLAIRTTAKCRTAARVRVPNSHARGPYITAQLPARTHTRTHTWNSSDRCCEPWSNCFVTRYPGRPILTAAAWVVRHERGAGCTCWGQSASCDLGTRAPLGRLPGQHPLLMTQHRPRISVLTLHVPLLRASPVLRMGARFCGAGAAAFSAASRAARFARFCWWRLPCTVDTHRGCAGRSSQTR